MNIQKIASQMSLGYFIPMIYYVAAVMMPVVVVFRGQAAHCQKIGDCTALRQTAFSFYLFGHIITKDKYQLDYSVNASQYRFSGEHASYYSSQKEFQDKFGEDSQIYKQHCSPSCDV